MSANSVDYDQMPSLTVSEVASDCCLHYWCCCGVEKVQQCTNYDSIQECKILKKGALSAYRQILKQLALNYRLYGQSKRASGILYPWHLSSSALAWNRHRWDLMSVVCNTRQQQTVLLYSWRRYFIWRNFHVIRGHFMMLRCLWWWNYSIMLLLYVMSTLVEHRSDNLFQNLPLFSTFDVVIMYVAMATCSDVFRNYFEHRISDWFVSSSVTTNFVHQSIQLMHSK